MPLLFDCTPNGVFTTSSFTTAIRNAMNGGKWTCTVTPTNAFGTYSGFHCLFGNADGGVWIVNSQIHIYRNEDAGAVAVSDTGTLTNAAGNPFTITVDPVARQTTIAGAGAGNGTFNWAGSAPTTIFANASIGVGRYSDGTSYVFAGSISDVDDFVTSLSGDAALTLGALTAAAAGNPEVSGDSAVTLGTVTVLGEDTPYGSAAISLGAVATSATGTIDLNGDGAVTLGAATTSSTATGPSAWSVGASTVKQRSNAFGPVSGTFTTDAVSTTTGSILVAFVARGSWSNAANPKGPTDSQGNTWTAVSPGDQNYSGYPNSRFGLWWCVNNAGSASHTFSATWGAYEGGGAGDEVTIGMVELKGPVMLDSSTWVERASASTVSGSAVTPTGPSITLAVIGGGGPTGQTHTFTLTAAAIAAGFVDVAGATANGDPYPGVGYIQSSVKVLIDETGTKTGASQNVSVNGTSNEGGQFFQAVFQTAAGILATGAAPLGALTASGDGAFPVLGDAAPTLGSLALAAAAAVDVSGDAGVALGAVALGATSEIDVAGIAVAQLGELIGAGTGMIDAGAIEGSASVVLGSLVIAGVGFGAAVTADAAVLLGPISIAGVGSNETDPIASLQGNIMPTTAATLRDHIIRLITELVPSVLERDRFRPYQNERNADFVDATEASSQCFRWFQVRDTGRFGTPLVSNTDVSARLVTFEILVAYPQTHRTGPQNALDRDDAMDADERSLDHLIGLHGYQNFNGIAGPQASWVDGAVVRVNGNGVDYLLISQTMRYHRLQ